MPEATARSPADPRPADCLPVEAALALGEPLDPSGQAHLAACPRCTRSAALLRLSRSPLPAVLPAAPTLPTLRAQASAARRRQAGLRGALALAALALLTVAVRESTLDPEAGAPTDPVTARAPDPAALHDGTADLMEGLDLLNGEADEDSLLGDFALLDPYPSEELDDPTSTLFGARSL